MHGWVGHVWKGGLGMSGLAEWHKWMGGHKGQVLVFFICINYEAKYRKLQQETSSENCSLSVCIGVTAAQPCVRAHTARAARAARTNLMRTD
jgi:hypothetical protein